jgi:hypothetical protein
MSEETTRMRDRMSETFRSASRRADRSHPTDAAPQPIHGAEYHLHAPRAFGPRTDAEPTWLPFCANFADLTVDSPGTYYSGLATADIELCRAPFLVARQHSPNGQTARAH